MADPWKIEGKHALVFGASKGIGRATAVALAERGAQITAVARSAEDLSDLLGALESISNLDHRVEVLDINDHASLVRVVEQICSRGAIHIWINNTGGPPGGLLTTAKPEDLAAAFHQHILTAQLISQQLIPSMKAAGYGRIINVISTSVKEPIPGLGVSNTIRGAMGNWAKTLATELAPFGITVNNVLPGFTKTGRLTAIIEKKAEKAKCSTDEMTKIMKSYVPMGRFATPEELARGICFLACPAASYITGINMPIDGGRTKSL